jgi:hypothetical protein
MNLVFYWPTSISFFLGILEQGQTYQHLGETNTVLKSHKM